MTERDPVIREFLLAFWKIHILHHAEEQGVDEAEDGRIGADTERQRADDDHGKAGLATKLPQPVIEVGGRRFERSHAARLAALFFHLLDAADRESGPPKGLVSRHALGDELRGLLFAMELQLRG